MHSPLPNGRPYIIDGHVDLLYQMSNDFPDTPFENLDELPVTLAKMADANVLVLVTALYCPDTFNGDGSSVRFLQTLINRADKYLTGLEHILSRSDLENCRKEKKHGMIWLVENADGLVELDRDLLARTGIRSVGLTHMGRNRLGDGNTIPFPNGLTRMGSNLVQELGRNGFAFDVAHLAEPGFKDLIRLHEGMLLSSHTGVRALCDTPRNLSKEQIRIILERRGVIGVAADPRMLSPDGRATIEDMFRHIDWIAQSFEADGIAVGTDFCGFHSVNASMEDISRLPDLAAIMLSRGYPEQSVHKIMGQNWFNFYNAILPA